MTWANRQPGKEDAAARIQNPGPVIRAWEAVHSAYEVLEVRVKVENEHPITLNNTFGQRGSLEQTCGEKIHLQTLLKIQIW